MNKILNLVLKFSGMGKVWALLDGKKTYGSAAIGILTALLGIATSLAPILAAHDTMGLWAFIQGLPSNPSWLLLIASVGGLGLGHKISKASSEVVAVEAPKP